MKRALSLVAFTQNREDKYRPARLLIAVSKSEDPRDGWWTYIDEVGGNNNSLDYQFLGVNSSVLVVANKMTTMDLGNECRPVLHRRPR